MNEDSPEEIMRVWQHHFPEWWEDLPPGERARLVEGTRRAQAELRLREENEAETKALYRRVYDELGGPMPLPLFRRHHPDSDRQFLRLEDNEFTWHACRCFPYREIDGYYLQEFYDDDRLRAWPWIAHMAMQYSLDQRGDRTKDLSHSQTLDLLERIELDFERLVDHLASLEAAARLRRPVHPTENRKAQMLDGILWNIETELVPFDISMQRYRLKAILQEQRTFLQEIDPAEFRPSGERLVGLRRLVFVGGYLWEDFYGKTPSAAKVARKDGSTDPPFVIFLRNIAAFARNGSLPGVRLPTRKQIERALREVLEHTDLR